MLVRQTRRLGHAGHRAGQALERRGERGNAAAVGAVGKGIGIGAAEIAHDLAQPALHRVVVLDVAARRLAILHRRRQEAAVLARAVVEGSGRRLALAHQLLDRALQARRMGAAFEIVLAQPDLAEPGPHRLDMALLAAVRGAGESDVLVAQPEALDRAAFDEGHGLDRLVGRPRQDGRVDVAPRGHDRAVRLHDGRDPLVPAFDDRSPRHLDRHHALAHHSRSSFTTVTLS